MVDDKENQPRSFKIDHHHPKSLGCSSAFEEGKLWIKLKIPKREEDVDEDSQSGSQEKDHHNTKICQVCNKVFTSGKALGGHMRIHFQAYKELISKRKLKAKHSIKFKKQKAIGFAKNKNINKCDNKKPECVLCGKNFPSMKSLFGHMRCHPERDWRGIEPPPSAKNSSSTSSSVSDAEPEKIDDQIDSAGDTSGNRTVDLKESLPGWSVTARRGRKAVATTSAISSSEEEKLRDAVHDLMRLAHGDSLEPGLTHKQKVDELETTNSISLTYNVENDDANRVIGLKTGRIDESPDGFSVDHPLMQLRNEWRGSTNGGHVQGLGSIGMIDVGKGKSAVESVDLINEYEDKDSSDDESDSKNSEQLDHKYYESTNGKMPMIKNKKRKKMKLRDLDQMKDASPIHQTPITMTTATPDKYRCSTCGKCFPTHQALGGHRSSHNKLKIVIHNSVDESSSAAADDDDLANPMTQVEENKDSEGAASSKLVEGTHQCNICNKNFHSGQALGGHKRCHWSGPVEAQSSQVMSPDEVSQTGRKILDFDLNEAPPMEDEANIRSEHVTGIGYASSSYNSVA